MNDKAVSRTAPATPSLLIIPRLVATFITHPQFYVFVLQVIEELEKVWNSVVL